MSALFQASKYRKICKLVTQACEACEACLFAYPRLHKAHLWCGQMNMLPCRGTSKSAMHCRWKMRGQCAHLLDPSGNLWPPCGPASQGTSKRAGEPENGWGLVLGPVAGRLMSQILHCLQQHLTHSSQYCTTYSAERKLTVSRCHNHHSVTGTPLPFHTRRSKSGAPTGGHDCEASPPCPPPLLGATSRGASARGPWSRPARAQRPRSQCPCRPPSPLAPCARACC